MKFIIWVPPDDLPATQRLIVAGKQINLVQQTMCLPIVLWIWEYLCKKELSREACDENENAFAKSILNKLFAEK
ncbi:MAG: hypothetical protein AB8G99_08980 [Planctomycetaceae bacterium]